jgi:hypothetical protein
VASLMMTLSSIFSPGAFASDLRHATQNWRRGAALALLMLALLAGKASLAGLLPGFEGPAFLLQFRTIFLALAILISIGMPLRGALGYEDARLWWMLAFLAVCLLHALFLPGGVGSTGYVTDFAFLLVMLGGLPMLVRDVSDRRLGALVTLGISAVLAIYMLILTHYAEPGAPLPAINLTILRISFFGLAAGIYLLATQRGGLFWICLAMMIVGVAVLDTALKAAVVMIVTMTLSILVAGLISASVRRSGFYWPVIIALMLGFAVGLAQNYSLLQIRSSQALAWNQPDDVEETRENMEWVARTLDFYDVAPETPAVAVWPGIIKPFTCLAIIDESRMTAAEFVGHEVPKEAWRCLFVDKTIRLRLYLEALQQFITSPLLGTGFGSYEVNTREFDFHRYTYPHNILLEILGSAGMIVFVLFCGTLVNSFWAACKASSTHPETIAAVVFLPTILAAGMFGGDIYDFRFYFVAALLFVPWAKAAARR